MYWYSTIQGEGALGPSGYIFYTGARTPQIPTQPAFFSGLQTSLQTSSRLFATLILLQK